MYCLNTYKHNTFIRLREEGGENAEYSVLSNNVTHLYTWVGRDVVVDFS